MPYRNMEAVLGLGHAHQAKEKLLQIDNAAISRELLQHTADMLVKYAEIGHLGPSKVRPDKGSGMLPEGAIRVEDTDAPKVLRMFTASLTNVEVWKTGR